MTPKSAVLRVARARPWLGGSDGEDVCVMVDVAAESLLLCMSTEKERRRGMEGCGVV